MEIAGFFSAIIIGLIIGVLGRLILPGKQNLSFLVTLAVGVVAAIVGTLVAGALGVDDTAGIDWIELGLQLAFAVAGVAILDRTYGRRTH
ncbi:MULTISPECIES: GlsB/YeaQ/YmgE family stress response membrane protein [unclassified Micromonospora]|uniref:GlsB/YeaQ/YmgE family stress response membrane protein n=1 Tax=unclassified Micromonospora TaxID=2617518 RepID=UPI00249C0F60|nr:MULTISPECIES: GlsB/YeaQ/YmgE family stress response membrane protein [unclassified Micromonospora]WFE54719.1 GlsB/YeaQ/YmgE family stress response membrane protein [Micromonospora sp. WMMD1155]WFE98746.1 GlsB/YeaQ/YmgE family stress response membrane protein [Micromonospora sp. WMMD964]